MKAFRTNSVFLLFVLALALLPGCSGNRAKDLRGSRPNIVFILADDLGWADLPVYGNPFNEAPNIDRLAAEGIRFTDAYAAAPVCSPTRASIISGQYPARVGITDFIYGHWRPFEEVVVPRNRQQYLPLELQTLGEVMKSAGYATGYFGKWHLGDSAYYPGKQGFDEVNVYQGGGYDRFADRMSVPVQTQPGTLLWDALTTMGTNFIEEHRHEPFFLFLAHFDVHVQLDADSALISKYLLKKKAEDYPCNAIYAAMVEEVDRSVGRILKKLDEAGLEENTIVVFFSDNGGLVSRYDRIPLLAESKKHIYEHDTLLYVASSNAPLRGEKGTLYEGGIREPLIIWWPGVLDGGQVNERIITSTDFLPTLASLAGAELQAGQPCDGLDLVPLLEGKPGNPERTVFWHYPVYHHDVPASAVRSGRWKLIHKFTGEPFELYNLEEDMGERRNLASEEPEMVDSLSGLLNSWYREVDAEFPAANPGFDPEKRYLWGIHPDRR